MQGRDIVKTYFQEDRVEMAYRHPRGDISLSPVLYRLPGRVESHPSVLKFFACEIIALVLWNIESGNMSIGYEDFMDE